LNPAFGQLPVIEEPDHKLTIAFNRNVELLGFMYFIAYEAQNIETATVPVGGRDVSKKEWHAYGYRFYTEYRALAGSPHISEAMGVAEHLWLSHIIPLLLRLDDFPHARIDDRIDPRVYL